MSGFRKDQTGVAQTAANTAATLVAAALTAGVITDLDVMRTEFDSIRAATFNDLKLVVDTDNELFASVDAATPVSSASAYRGSKSASNGSGDAGSVVIEYGAFKGLGKTIAEVFALTAPEADSLTNGGYSKSGREYVEWMSGNEKNGFMQKKSLAFLESVRAGSDA